MKTIKFRIWDKDKEMYLPPDIMALTNGPNNAFAVMVKDWENYQVGEYAYPHSQEAEQFTGLLDKNGKEIYEGDVIRVIDKEDYPEPITLIGKVDSGKWGTWVFGYGYLEDFEGLYEVIGNIHENPELL